MTFLLKSAQGKLWRFSTERSRKTTTIRILWGLFILMKELLPSTALTAKEFPPQNRLFAEERGLYKNVKVMDILLYLADLKDYPLQKPRKEYLLI